MTDEPQLGQDLQRKARRLFELRETRDIDAAAAKKSEEEYRDFEQEFWQALDESPVKGSLKLDLGGSIGVVSFSPRETYYGRLLDVEKAQAHFENRAMVDEMFEPKVAKRRLNEYVRECLDTGTPLPDGIDFYAQRGITISKQKS